MYSLFLNNMCLQIQDLRECMLANPDYYRPMLEEEDHYLDEKESQQTTSEQSTANVSPEQTLDRKTVKPVS